MQDKYGKYLPIGTIVLLREGTKRLMITGFCMSEQNNPNVVYDYCGCLYPEGVLKTDQTLLFNHNQISKIFYLGFTDEEQKKFSEQLKNIVNKK